MIKTINRIRLPEVHSGARAYTRIVGDAVRISSKFSVAPSNSLFLYEGHFRFFAI